MAANLIKATARNSEEATRRYYRLIGQQIKKENNNQE